ncbi:MAG: hypothetical protein IPL53_20035 [Ignavibacteria bacterium]|nr:hypothetical protein [Ignavibacteria bacterium]
MKQNDKLIRFTNLHKVSASRIFKLQTGISILCVFLFISILDIQAQFVERNKLTGTGNNGPSGQGSSVSISDDGNVAIVGGQNDNGGYGAAWIYEKTVQVTGYRNHQSWLVQVP